MRGRRPRGESSPHTRTMIRKTRQTARTSRKPTSRARMPQDGRRWKTVVVHNTRRPRDKLLLLPAPQLVKPQDRLVALFEPEKALEPGPLLWAFILWVGRTVALLLRGRLSRFSRLRSGFYSGYPLQRCG